MLRNSYGKESLVLFINCVTIQLILLAFRTPFRNAPTIGGKEVDLYLLYWLATTQGGWERVSLFRTTL